MTHPNAGRKQSMEHIAKRVNAIRITKSLWTDERIALNRQRVSESALGRPGWLRGKSGDNYPEYIRKINSECHKGIQMGEKHPMYGKPMPDLTKAKLLAANLGRKQSYQWIQKRIEGRAGYRHSMETKLKIGGANSGKGNGNWLGGTSREPYALIWGSKLFKDTIRERDNHTCQNPECKKNCNTLSIHHIDYNKKNCNSKNLITLCRSCNGRANFNRDFWEAGYKEIIRLKCEMNQQQTMAV